MKRVLAIVIIAAAAAYGVAAAKKTARIESRLHSLDRRAEDLEDAVELLDTRTDGMEYDMKYNFKRHSDFGLYDIDVDDDNY